MQSTYILPWLCGSFISHTPRIASYHKTQRVWSLFIKLVPANLKGPRAAGISMVQRFTGSQICCIFIPQNTTPLETFRIFPLIYKVFLLQYLLSRVKLVDSRCPRAGRNPRGFYPVHEVKDGETVGSKVRDTYKGRGGSAWLEGAFIPTDNLWFVSGTSCPHGHLLFLKS